MVIAPNVHRPHASDTLQPQQNPTRKSTHFPTYETFHRKDEVKEDDGNRSERPPVSDRLEQERPTQKSPTSFPKHDASSAAPSCAAARTQRGPAP